MRPTDPFPLAFYLVIKVHMPLCTGVVESFFKTLRGSEATKPINELHSSTEIWDLVRLNLIGVKAFSCTQITGSILES